MDEMVEIEYKAYIDLQWPRYSDSYHIVGITIEPTPPDDQAFWLEMEAKMMLELTEREAIEMYGSVTRTLSFEIAVTYNEKDGAKKATDATLQNTGVPNYVKAYLENEAMKMVNESKEEVKRG